jgi:gluconolactonase
VTRTHQIPMRAEAQISTGVPASVIGTGLRTVVDGLDHAEGICWSPAEQMLYAGANT